jgi:prepilin peptidase CpaA
VPLVAAALIVAFALCSFGWIGGGDAKLFAATCLWFEPEAILIYSLCAALIAGMLTLLIIFLRNMPLLSMLSGKGWLVRLHEPRGGHPYGIALAAAGLLVYPNTPFMARWASEDITKLFLKS